MALPGGLYIGQPVQYLPNIFDTVAWNKSQGPVAAIITGIDSGNNTIDLTIFPAERGPFFRSKIPYYTDAATNNNGFKLSSDTLTCGTDVGSISVTDTSATNFVVEFVAPAGSNGYEAFYRVSGGGSWLTTTAIIYELNKVTFTGLTTGVTYDVLIKNVCNNGVASAGVSVTDTATTPL